jgi:5-methylcytosine-specific restriction endonuclease McrA
MKSKRSHKKISNAPILVLNSDYLPINITDFRKAFNLVYKGKAEVIVDVEEIVNTMDKRFKKPSVIRLTYHVNVPFRKVTLSKENIFRRDKHKCAYCDSKHQLTIDHIFPKSKGGKDSWDNLISACWRCNSRKGDRTPEEAGMKLLFTPYKPSPLHFMCESNKFREGWKTYLGF